MGGHKGENLGGVRGENPGGIEGDWWEPKRMLQSQGQIRAGQKPGQISVWRRDEKTIE